MTVSVPEERCRKCWISRRFHHHLPETDAHAFVSAGAPTIARPDCKGLGEARPRDRVVGGTTCRTCLGLGRIKEED